MINALPLPWQQMHNQGVAFYNNDRVSEYELTKDTIFVFGSNEAGRHGAGAAKAAVLYHSAIVGVGSGRQGMSYGITTKDAVLRVLPISTIRDAVANFVEYTKENPDLYFFVTAVGTGYARIPDEIMAPMFVGAERCFFPSEWQDWLA